jgi:hypothetical protein
MGMLGICNCQFAWAPSFQISPDYLTVVHRGKPA